MKTVTIIIFIWAFPLRYSLIFVAAVRLSVVHGTLLQSLTQWSASFGIPINRDGTLCWRDINVAYAKAKAGLKDAVRVEKNDGKGNKDDGREGISNTGTRK